ncbi:MAG: acyl-CoA dehydrogenase [Rhodococcus sp. (in: high G+C Gram-positive bacteria)]
MSVRDIEFLLYDWLEAETLTERTRYADHSRETFDAFLDVSRAIAEREFAPHNRTSDVNEPEFDGKHVYVIPEVKSALAAFADAGLVGATFDEERGGLQLPQVVQRACMMWFYAANAATSSYAQLTMANANLLLAHGSEEQIAMFVPPMVEGRFTGTMCMSEPQAGSSLADVTTRATPDEDGSYRLAGAKMWISGGEHEFNDNIVHLVLARTPGARPGVKGISLFVVPKFLVNSDGSIGERNDVVLAGLNHKMGFRGTTNTFLKFGEGVHTPLGKAGALGYLVGEEGQGLAYMFHMMNEARIDVGAVATALGYTGYLHALDYARIRTQGRSYSNPAEPVPIIRHPDVRRMLLAAKSYVEGGLALVMYAARLVDEQRTAADQERRDESDALLDTLTPIVKSWPSKWCLEANDIAIQVHGGYGYTREYPVEQFYRDNRLNPIHEGTFGVQALDLLGRKVRLRDGLGLRLLLDRIRTACDKAPERFEGWSKSLQVACSRIESTSAHLIASPVPGTVQANASTYLDALGHVVIAWLWLELSTTAEGKPADEFTQGKIAAARYFFTFELPTTEPMFDLLDSQDQLLLELQDEVL